MTVSPSKILIIQTAFIGDVILSTSLIEALSEEFPESKIDFLLRKGNESLLHAHPKLNEVIVWDKSRKYQSLLQTVRKCNNNGEPYDLLINLQRFFTTGLMSAMIRAKLKIGFDKNPLSFLMDEVINHNIGNSKHEIERNMELLKPLKLRFNKDYKPRLYPRKDDFAFAKKYSNSKYITVSPASVWFTKQLQASKWIELIDLLPPDCAVLLLGGPGDRDLCETIKNVSAKDNVINLAGESTFLQTAALMKYAILNYSNDSAPLHIASSQNAGICAVFCSTVPEFGFGPLSDFNRIVQVEELYCKPCGLHGYSSCPEKHFKCSADLQTKKLLNAYSDAVNFKFDSNGTSKSI